VQELTIVTAEELPAVLLDGDRRPVDVG
jgi:hypothetical protein